MVRGFDAGSVSVADAVALVDWFAEIERIASAGKTLAAGRAALCEPSRGTGDRSAADWLAKRTGSTVGDARSALDTASNLTRAPETDDAFPLRSPYQRDRPQPRVRHHRANDARRPRRPPQPRPRPEITVRTHLPPRPPRPVEWIRPDGTVECERPPP